MPWLETAPMEQRERFIDDSRLGLYDMTELCARYAISRKTGYKWLARYDAGGRPALHDRSRAPHHCPHKIGEAVAQLLVDAARERGAAVGSRRGDDPSGEGRRVQPVLGRADPVGVDRLRVSLVHLAAPGEQEALRGGLALEDLLLRDGRLVRTTRGLRDDRQRRRGQTA